MQIIIVAGGLSRRLGGVPKAGLILEGQTLLARTVDAAADFLEATGLETAGRSALPATAEGELGREARIAVVGPVEKIDQWLTTARHGAEVVAVQEDPPFAGPAAGLAAGLGALTAPADFVLVLACDMPHAGDLMRLLHEQVDASEPGGGVMVSAEGRKQPLAAIYPRAALQESVAAARAAHRLENASVFSLIAKVNTKECVVPAELAADIDTWADARAQGIAAAPATAEGQ